MCHTKEKYARLGASSTSLGAHVEIFQVSDVPIDALNAKILFDGAHYIISCRSCVAKMNARHFLKIPALLFCDAQKAGRDGARPSRSSATYCSGRRKSYAGSLRKSLTPVKKAVSHIDRQVNYSCLFSIIACANDVLHSQIWLEFPHEAI